MDIPVQGITGLDSDLRQKMRSGKGVIKLLGRLRREGARFQMDVGPRLIPANHPLAGVNGADKGISFDTDSMGRVTVIGGRSNPRGAAAALLKDLIGLYSEPIF
jgi:homoserine dehydrogenase